MFGKEPMLGFLFFFLTSSFLTAPTLDVDLLAAEDICRISSDRRRYFSALINSFSSGVTSAAIKSSNRNLTSKSTRCAFVDSFEVEGRMRDSNSSSSSGLAAATSFKAFFEMAMIRFVIRSHGFVNFFSYETKSTARGLQNGGGRRNKDGVEEEDDKDDLIFRPSLDNCIIPMSAKTLDPTALSRMGTHLGA